MNIVVRRAKASDAEAVKNIYEQENAYSSTLQLPHPSLALWEKRMANTADNVFVYVALIGDEVVGNLGFEVCTSPRRRHVGSFGMGVRDDMQGKGVGSALLSTVIDLADNWLNLKRIELTVYADNVRAVNLYKKHGFAIEGESPAYAFRNGDYVSAYHMARIKS